MDVMTIAVWLLSALCVGLAVCLVSAVSMVRRLKNAINNGDVSVNMDALRKYFESQEDEPDNLKDSFITGGPSF